MSKIKGFIGETMIYGFGNVFSRFFAMLLIPLYAQYLGKVDYSNLVMLQSVFGILTVLLALNSGVFFYYYEYENLRYRKIVMTSWFYYQIAIAVFLLGLIFLLAPTLSEFFIVSSDNSSQIQWCLVLLGIQLFPYIFNITNINYFRIERKPKKVVIIVALEASFTLVFVLVSLVALELGIVSVVLSQVLARLIVSISFIKIPALYVNIKYFSRKLLRKLLSFSWPFIITSVTTVIIINVDKFIGTQVLSDKTDVALLALAMQLVLPITVLADMIRMALGPFIMSIRKEAGAAKDYQKIFDLTVFSASIVMILLVLITPLLTLILTDSSYMEVVFLIPLLGFANILSLVANQFCVYFSLVKKNVYIFYAFVLSGVITIVLNALFMQSYGFIVSGYSQIISYVVMSVFLYIMARRITEIKLNLKKSLILIFVVISYVALVSYLSPQVVHGEYFLFIAAGLVFLILTIVLFTRQQRINPVKTMRSLLSKSK